MSALITAIKDRIKGKPKARRAPEWPKTRHWYLECEPRCAVCGSTENLEVHHVVPYHIRPDLELSVMNLITLCESKKQGINCHLFVGHLGDYKAFNPSVRLDAKTLSDRIKNRPFSQSKEMEPIFSETDNAS